MAGKNIDKDLFNRNFQRYMDNTDRQVDNWLYGKFLHEDILTIIHNVCYHWDFNDERLCFEDVEADLLVHLQVKKDALRKYSGNWYNIIFTSFRRKLYDILRSHRDENESLGKLHDFCNHNLDTIELNNITHDLEEPEPQPKQPEREQEEVPEVLPVQRVEDVQTVEVAGRTLVQVVRRKRKADASKRGRPYNSDRTGLQLTIGF
jgi:hypothetical protein